jgi:uncharacterized membrane protein YdbT with pleckstrin-like domain
MEQGAGVEKVVYSGHPSWRSMLDFHLVSVVVAVVAGLIGKLASGWGIAVAAFAVVFVISLLIGWVRRSRTLYTITDQRLHIRTGLLSRDEQHTTLSHVQNVNTSQSLLERMLRIGTVDFDTAGSEDSQFKFEGVASPRKVVAAIDLVQQRAGIPPV